MSLLVKMTLDVVEDLLQTRRRNAPADSIGTRPYRCVPSGQAHGDSVADLFSEQASAGGGLGETGDFVTLVTEVISLIPDRPWFAEWSFIAIAPEASRKSVSCLS
jgi:hypothetical protein